MLPLSNEETWTDTGLERLAIDQQNSQLVAILTQTAQYTAPSTAVAHPQPEVQQYSSTAASTTAPYSPRSP